MDQSSLVFTRVIQYHRLINNRSQVLSSGYHRLMVLLFDGVPPLSAYLCPGVSMVPPGTDAGRYCTVLHRSKA